MIRIACCQYQIEELSNWESYIVKIEKLVFDAKKEGAKILLMPEYAGIEIACNKFTTDGELYRELQPLIPKYIDFYQNIARVNQIYIQAGTIIEKTKLDKFVNRAYLFSPNGSYDYQDKLQLTEYEKSLNLFQHGEGQKIFETPFGKIGIAICYDSEFPEIVRNLVRNGASIILVPSYTTSLAGFNRVFLSCRARAIENQCFVAISYIVNKVDISAEIENTYGQAAILSPVDAGFPNDGIIAQCLLNKSMLVVGDVVLEKLDWVRINGQVLNYNDALRYEFLENHPIELIKLF